LRALRHVVHRARSRISQLHAHQVAAGPDEHIKATASQPPQCLRRAPSPSRQASVLSPIRDQSASRPDRLRRRRPSPLRIDKNDPSPKQPSETKGDPQAPTARTAPSREMHTISGKLPKANECPPTQKIADSTYQQKAHATAATAQFQVTPKLTPSAQPTTTSPAKAPAKRKRANSLLSNLPPCQAHNAGAVIAASVCLAPAPSSPQCLHSATLDEATPLAESAPHPSINIIFIRGSQGGVRSRRWRRRAPGGCSGWVVGRG